MTIVWMMWPSPIICVWVGVYVRGAYWHLWETGGNVSLGSQSFSVQIGLLEPVCCTRPAVLTRKQCS